MYTKSPAQAIVLLLELTLAHTNFNLNLDVFSLLVKQYMEKEIVVIGRYAIDEISNIPKLRFLEGP